MSDDIVYIAKTHSGREYRIEAPKQDNLLAWLLVSSHTVEARTNDTHEADRRVVTLNVATIETLSGGN